MVVVFILGLLVSSLMERRAEVASVFNNKRTVFEDSIVAQNEKFKADYPREYETWAMTEDTTFKSKYNSSQEVDVLEQRPEMVVLWAGYAFSRHYNTPRGHKHALEDMRKILRTGNPGIMLKTADGRDSIAADMQPATCWTCKGPDVPRMMRELSSSKSVFDPANFYAKKWSELGAEEVNTIGCSDCHDARTMDLRPARPALYEAFARRGLNVKDVTHQEMRSLVCAQCHVEYYFAPDGKATTLPYTGLSVMNPDDMYAFYESIGFTDYTNPRTGVKQLKTQHPEFETYMGAGSVHASMFTCADCHMEKVTKEDGTTYLSHALISPLQSDSIKATCAACHADLDAFVHGIQEKMEERTIAIGNKLAQLTDKLADAVASGKYTDEQLDAIRALNRKGQWYWDFVFVENSEGAHNSKLDNSCLDKADALIEEALSLLEF